MRSGRVVDGEGFDELIFKPKHEYTDELIRAALRPGSYGERAQVSPGESAVEVLGLTKVFAHGSGQQFQAVDAVAFAVEAGRVGESGSGKSTTARLIHGLARPSAGTVRLAGREATNLVGQARREVWRHIQLVHQNPQVALDPRLTVKQIIAEPLRAFDIGNRAERPQRIAELLDQVGLPHSVLQRRPREFSGGQQQRVAIARALAPHPRVVVLDEALSALDVVTQGRILNLLEQLQRELNLTYLFISHDLDLVRSLADAVAVLWRGRLIEIRTHPPSVWLSSLRLHPRPATRHARKAIARTSGVPGRGVSPRLRHCRMPLRQYLRSGRGKIDVMPL
jgi:peptide/nickel transport system ATP-binding protein